MTDFSKDSDELTEEEREEAKVLLAKKDEIIRALVTNGLKADDESPYAYIVPTDLAFDYGHGKWQLRSIWAIVLMARASYARAYWLDCDKEGFPELPDYTGVPYGFHRVYITDPFAQLLDRAIDEYQDEMVRTGKAQIVNGRFFKVA